MQSTQLKTLIDAIASSPEDTEETCKYIARLVILVTSSAELRESAASAMAYLVSSESRNARQNGYLALRIGADRFQEFHSQLQAIRFQGREEKVRQEREGNYPAGYDT